MRVDLDGQVCQGHARCWEIIPEIFRIDDDGYAIPLENSPVEPEREEAVLRAVRNCPERAITAHE